MGAVSAHQDKLVIFSYAAEAIRPTITAYFIKRDAGDERGMSLAPCDYSLFPRREYRNKVVLAPGLGNVAMRYIRNAEWSGLTRMKRPSGDHETQVNAPK